MRKSISISRGLSAVVLIGTLGACAPASGLDNPTAAPATPAAPAAPGTATGLTVDTREQGRVGTGAAVRSNASAAQVPVSRVRTPDPSRYGYCGTIRAVDVAKGILTFRTTASYVYGGESPTDIRSESGTYTAKVDANTAVGDDRTGTRRPISGDLRTRLAYAQRHGSGSDRAFFEISNGRISQIGVNMPVSRRTDGCGIDITLPDPSRTDWCGVVTGFDSRHGTLTFRAVASYVWGGETFQVRPENATFTVQGSGNTAVYDQTGGRNRLIDGTLHARYTFAKRHSSGAQRVYFTIDNGFVKALEVNKPVKGKTLNGCQA